MAVMTPTPQWNRGFIPSPLCPRWLLWPPGEDARPPNRSEERVRLDCRTPGGDTL